MENNFNFIVKVTTACTGNCKCCTNIQKKFEEQKFGLSIFDLKVFEKICKNIKKLGGTYVCLSGGEPTIVKNINDYIKMANKYELASRINTNGWNVDYDNLKTWLENGLSQIVLSVYGIDEKTVEKTRGNAEIFKRSIIALNAIKKLKKEYNFVFIFQTVIMKDTYKQLPQLLNLAIEYNANLFWPSYLEDAFNLPEIRLTKEEIKDFKENVIPKMKNIISSQNYSKTLKRKLLNSLDNYYPDDIDEYIYYKCNKNCR